MIHKGSNGELGQIQPNGSLEMGDSLAWTCHWSYYSESDFDLDFFEVKSGAYVRHPDPKQTNNGFGAYYKDPKNGCISRDQLTGLLCECIRRRDVDRAYRIISHHKRGGKWFAYNSIINGADPKTAKRKTPDITFADIWALELRAKGPKGKDFVKLFFLDLWLLLSVLLYNVKRSTDPINLGLKVITCYEHYPTMISRITFKLLKKRKFKEEMLYYWGGWRDMLGMFHLTLEKLKKLGV